MKEIIYRCDRCGKTITDNLYGVYIEKMDRKNKELRVEDNPFPYPEDADLDFCVDCAKVIHDYLRKPPKAVIPAPAAVMEIPVPAAEVMEELPYDGCQELAEYAELTGKEQPAEQSRKRRPMKLDADLIMRRVEEGVSPPDIAKELGANLQSVRNLINRRKKSAVSVYGETGLEGKLQELAQEAKNLDKPMPKPEKKKWYDPEKVVVERSDDGRRTIVSKRKPTPSNGEPIKVSAKNCMTCSFVSQGGYCDYLTATGEERKDKPGMCTHRVLR